MKDKKKEGNNTIITSSKEMDNKINNNINKSINEKEISPNMEKEIQVGNYLIKKTLGEGTFGKVKLGIYLPNNKKVAIKIIKKKKN